MARRDILDIQMGAQAQHWRTYAFVVALSFLWTQAAFAAKPCQNAAGLEIECPDHVQQVVSAEDDFTLEAGGGYVASLSSETSKGEPSIDLAIGVDVVKGDELSPRLDLMARFGAFPGETIALEDPTTFRSFAADACVSKQFWKTVIVKPAALFGLEFRFKGAEAEPRHRAARYGYLGIRIDGKRGFLFLGAGPDERLSTTSRESPAYLPTAAAFFKLKLGEITGKLKAYLTGRMLAFLRFGYGTSTAGSDVAQFGVLAVWAEK